MSRNIRAAQWKRIYATDDRWPRFAAAMKRWIKQHRHRTPPQAKILADKRVFDTTVATARRRLRRKTATVETAPPQLEPDELESAPLPLEIAPPEVEPAPATPELEPCILCTPAWTCGLHCLGDRGDVPREVHERMLELRLMGAVPCSTLEQRRRNALTSSSSYGVPTGLRDALKFGYLSPNLAPPEGFCWKGRGGQWALAPRGG